MSPVITCIEDLRQLARRRVPRMFYDYADSGSWTEGSYRANEADFQAIPLRQRVGVDVEHRSTTTTLLGVPSAMPVALAPVGALGMQRADGELLAARAARDFGVPFTLSTMSVAGIEDVAEASNGHPFWFQLYVLKDRAFVADLVARAKAAGCTALVVTMDLNVLGVRHKDRRNGLTDPSRMSLAQLASIAAHPRWALEMMRTPRRSFGNIVGHAEGVADMKGFARWRGGQHAASLSWADIDWLRRLWDGPLVLKGIHEVDDALRARQAGADAIVVSNHGGRQLDGAISSVRALPAIAEAVGTRMEVHMDGGVRSGQDVLKALALGARGVWVGRAYVYGLAALGQAGVTQALRILHEELDLSMALCGHTAIDQLGPHILGPVTSPTAAAA